MSTAEGEAVLRAVLTRAKATSAECDVLYTALRQLASLASLSPATSGSLRFRCGDFSCNVVFFLTNVGGHVASAVSSSTMAR
jgi:hypothetical protein